MLFFSACSKTVNNEVSKEKVFREFSEWTKPPLYQGNPFGPSNLGIQVFGSVFEGLFDYISIDGTYYPRLARSYENKGNQTIIHLQNNVRWNDGKKFTSKDIWAYYMLLNNKSPITKYLSRIETPDDDTVIFVWSDPQLNTNLKMQYLASDVQGTVQYDYYKKYVDRAVTLLNKGRPAKDVNKNYAFGMEFDSATIKELEDNFMDFINAGPELPLGTGPFKVASVTTSNLILERNPYYWNKKNIKFEKIILSYQNIISGFGPKYATRYADRFEGTPNKDDFNSTMSNKDLIHYMTFDKYSAGVIFNIQKEPFNDINVRKAIIYALDRNKISEAGGNGFGYVTPYATLGMPFTYAKAFTLQEVFNKLTPYTCDTKKAEKLLLSEGWTRGKDGIWRDKNGKIYNFEIYTNGLTYLPSEIAAEQLTKFGFKTKVINNGQDMLKFQNYIDMSSDKIEYVQDIYDPVSILKEFYLGFSGNAAHFTRIDGNLNLSLPGYDGKIVDVGKMLDEMSYMNDDDLKKAVSNLVWIANENVFGIPYYQNVSGFWINEGTIKGYPYPELVKEYHRNVPLQFGEEGKIINEHWYLWQSQARLIVNGVYSPK